MEKYHDNNSSTSPSDAPVAFLDVIAQNIQLTRHGVHGRPGKGAFAEFALPLSRRPEGGAVVSQGATEDGLRRRDALGGRRERHCQQVHDQRGHGDRQLNAKVQLYEVN